MAKGHRATEETHCSECGATIEAGEMMYGTKCAGCRAAMGYSTDYDRRAGLTDSYGHEVKGRGTRKSRIKRGSFFGI